MKIKLAKKKLAVRRMCDLGRGECFLRDGEPNKDKVFMIVMDGDNTHCLDLYSGELLEFTDEEVNPVNAILEYTPWSVNET
jgi:hypothetical protein